MMLDPIHNDTVLLDAARLQDLLNSGKVTSVHLTNLFLEQIDRHNNKGKVLNAVISTAPRGSLIAKAEALDRERREGKSRSALHGIPVLVKDAVVTAPELGMPTTVGSWAFSSLRARKNAQIVDQLIDAGAIILAKTNLTEFCGLKSNDTAVGWSAYGGQTHSPYRRDNLKDEDQPSAGGSSSGSAVSVIAGFAPLSIGTETSGSTVFPASLSGLYAMKLGLGSAATEGVFKLSREFDGIGVMARTPLDLAVLAETVMVPDALSRFPDSLVKCVGHPRDADMSIGVVPIGWGMPEGLVKGKWDLPAVVAKYEATVHCFRQGGAEVTYPFHVAEADTLKHGENDLTKVAYYEFPTLIEEFLGNFEETELASLQDIIAWNDKHAEKAMPHPQTGQTELIASLKSQMTPETRNETMDTLRRLADADGMGKAMHEQGVDVVVAASGSTLIVFAACAGWPVATCPLGNLDKNGEPYGVFATARSEDALFRFMGTWARTMEGAKGPVLAPTDGEK